MNHSSPSRVFRADSGISYRPGPRPRTVRGILGFVVAGLAFVVAACNVNAGSSSPRSFVEFEATIVFLNDGTYTTEPQDSVGERLCSPIGEHADLVVTGLVVFGDPPVSNYSLRGGSMENSNCVVDVALTIPDSGAQSVSLGCGRWFLDGENNVTASGDWSAGTLEYLGCIGLIEAPEDWPVDVLSASQRLRRDAIGALSAAGQAATRIESSPDSQQHPVSVQVCEERGIQDTDRDTFRLNDEQLLAVSGYWKDASYDVAIAQVDEAGSNDQLVIRAAMEGVGVIKLSWRTIGPNGDPFVLEIATACFERDINNSN